MADGVEPTGNPRQVSTLDHILWISTNSSCWWDDFIQIADIDASGTAFWNNNGSGGFYGFSPIGNDTDGNFFGTYDGQGHTIDGLYINRPGYDYLGFFGYGNSATIMNLGLTNVDITGEGTMGSLAGYSYNYTTISSCFSTGNISGAYRVIGGLVGKVGGPNSNISNCYSRCNVSGERTIGGLVGSLAEGTIINNCFSTSYVFGWNGNLGGLVGYNLSSSVLNNCFWDTQTSGQTTSSGGGTGKTTTVMKDVATFTDESAVGLDDAWDFINNPYDDIENDDDWNIYGTANDGYPFLSWQDYEVAPIAPTNVIITIIGDDVELYWNDMSATTYYVYRSTNPFEEDWGAAIGSSVVNSYTDEGAALETKYFYYITSVN